MCSVKYNGENVVYHESVVNITFLVKVTRHRIVHIFKGVLGYQG